MKVVHNSLSISHYGRDEQRRPDFVDGRLTIRLTKQELDRLAPDMLSEILYDLRNELSVAVPGGAQVHRWIPDCVEIYLYPVECTFENYARYMYELSHPEL